MGRILTAARLATSTLALSGLLFGCATNPDGERAFSSLFSAKTSSAAPVFKPALPAPAAKRQSTGLAQAISPDWKSDNPLYVAFFTLREFIQSRDEGKIDRTNLYKMLADVDNIYSSSAPAALPIPTQAIASPFPGLQPVQCNKAANIDSGKQAVALMETEEKINAMISWIWTDGPDHIEYGIATLAFDKVTQAISVDMVFSVDYNPATPTTDFNLRCMVNGNTNTNAFEFKYIIGDYKVVAKGVSRGEGKFMLFKYSGPGQAADPGGSVKYLVVPGTADEGYFMEQNTTPTAIFTDSADIPESVAEYKSWVVGADFLTSSDLMTDISQLNAGTPKTGTIYFDYQNASAGITD